ncbi:TPA: hypothetical protein HA242_01950 [Candidatus Woesearchaeota archaeon]|nr:hypothetical protein [Candidatus Woesearchaeota archaeon]HIG93395.1 hypothetical protein [Candidatus Woesearchaeota archaeon]HIH12463.1 hypothetical protein [Candidatus Woesearchaeota archaeon]
MSNPQFIEEKPISLVDAKVILDSIEARDTTLNYLSNKAKDYLTHFVVLTPHQKEELHKKLVNLKLTRLREEHFMKIIDFLPRSPEDLRLVLQAYPLSLPKKDQDSIVATVAEALP